MFTRQSVAYSFASIKKNPNFLELFIRQSNLYGTTTKVSTIFEKCKKEENMMPPTKLKLASKVKKLSTSLKVDQITRGVNADINGKSLPLETLEAVSKTNAIMEKAIAKSKANLRNLRPIAAVTNRDEEPQEPREEPKLDKSGKKRKLKSVVDLEMMKEELRQLEDPPKTTDEKRLCENKLGYEFFDVPAEELAKKLLGKILVRKLDNGTLLKGKIVETESYLGGEDRASASYQYRVSAANIATYMPPGTIYIYMTYGMYHCLSISSKGEGSVALIRALSPIEGADPMAEFRNARSKTPKTYKLHELSNGPSKFCIAFGLTRDHNKYSVCDWRGMWIEDNPEKESIQIVSCPRIGIDSSGPEWALKPMRYYILGEKSVSKTNKNAEAAFTKQAGIV